MPKTKNEKFKPIEKFVPQSVTRPPDLIQKFDAFLRTQGQFLKRTPGHSEAVRALEELVMENPAVTHLFVKKLKG